MNPKPDDRIVQPIDFIVDEVCSILTFRWATDCGLSVMIERPGFEEESQFLPPDRMLEFEEFVHRINTLNQEVKIQNTKSYSKTKKFLLKRKVKNDSNPKSYL